MKCNHLMVAASTSTERLPTPELFHRPLRFFESWRIAAYWEVDVLTNNSITDEHTKDGGTHNGGITTNSLNTLLKLASSGPSQCRGQKNSAEPQGLQDKSSIGISRARATRPKERNLSKHGISLRSSSLLSDSISLHVGMI